MKNDPQPTTSRSEMNNLVKAMGYAPLKGEGIQAGNPKHSERVTEMQRHILEMQRRKMGSRAYLKWARRIRNENNVAVKAVMEWLFECELPKRSALDRAQKSYAENGPAGLYPRFDLRGRDYQMTDKHTIWALDYVARCSDVCIKQLERDMAEAFVKSGLRMPSYATLRRFVKSLPTSVTCGLADPSRATFEKDICFQPHDRVNPMEMWQLDSSPAGYRVGDADSSSGVPVHRIVIRVAVPDGVIMASTWCYGAPTGKDFVFALKSALLGKGGQHGAYGGLCQIIQVDKATVYLDKDLQRACQALGIILQPVKYGDFPCQNGAVETGFAAYRAGYEGAIPDHASTLKSFRNTQMGHLTPEESDKFQAKFLRQYNFTPQKKGGLSRYVMHMMRLGDLGLDPIDDARVHRHVVYTHQVSKSRQGYIIDGVRFHGLWLSDIPKQDMLLALPPDGVGSSVEVYSLTFEKLGELIRTSSGKLLTATVRSKINSQLLTANALRKELCYTARVIQMAGISTAPVAIVPPRKKGKKQRVSSSGSPAVASAAEPTPVGEKRKGKEKPEESRYEELVKAPSTIVEEL